MPKFNPASDIPDLSGKVILITGGTAGIGAQTSLLLAAHSPAKILFTGHSSSSAELVIADVKASSPDIPVTFIKLDLASLTSEQSGAKEILSQIEKLDILILNAGIMALPPGLTTDGYEIQFGTNHLGHALLTKLLLPLMLETAKQQGSDVRIISLSSEAAQAHPVGGSLFPDLETPQSNLFFAASWQRYGQSKLANVLYASQLAKHYSDQGILAVSIHPGIFNTGLVEKLSLASRIFVWVGTAGQVKDAKKGGQGAWNTCWAAMGKREEIVNGGFLFPVAVLQKPFRETGNSKLAGKLWEWTEKELEAWK